MRLINSHAKRDSSGSPTSWKMTTEVELLSSSVTVIFLINSEERNKVDNKWIPVICGLAGIILGVVAMYIGVPDFPATDPLTAAAVGGASGLAATGMDQVVKQLKQ